MSLDPVILAQDLIRCPSVTPNEGKADLLQQHFSHGVCLHLTPFTGDTLCG